MDSEYKILEPEVPGGLGESSKLDFSTRPPTVIALHFEFAGWLGDDLITTTPCFIVTDSLRTGLQTFNGTGYTFAELIVSKSEEFVSSEFDPYQTTFSWLKVTGIAGVDDFGLDKGRLVVSKRAFEMLSAYQMSNCIVRRKPFLRKTQL
jgi:hypothetical protein